VAHRSHDSWELRRTVATLQGSLRSLFETSARACRTWSQALAQGPVQGAARPAWLRRLTVLRTSFPGGKGEPPRCYCSVRMGFRRERLRGGCTRLKRPLAVMSRPVMPEIGNTRTSHHVPSYSRVGHRRKTPWLQVASPQGITGGSQCPVLALMERRAGPDAVGRHH